MKEIKKAIRKVITKYQACRHLISPVKHRNCNICSTTNHFLPWKGPFVIPETVCSVCKSHSRHRLFNSWLMNTQLKGKILHFAPEKFFETKFRKEFSDDYLTTDITGNVDMVQDIHELEFPDNSFNTIICNHVLEHVDNDTKALSELRRVLSSEGRLIITIPQKFGLRYSTDESNVKELTKKDRIAYFGQSDHVRQYGADFEDILSQNGFKVNVYDIEFNERIEQAIGFDDKVYICQK